MVKVKKVLAIVGLALTSVLLWVPSALAAEGAADNPDSVKKFIAIAAGFGIAIAAFGGALGQGKAVAATLEGIARNPGASGKMFVPMIVGLALIESLVIYALVIAFQLAGKL
jgi:F-type H+-transporting ATPase subunit c